MVIQDEGIMGKEKSTAGIFCITFLTKTLFESGRLSAGLLLLVLNAGYTFADNAVIVGGGYDLRGSQAQIELNVKWVQQVLKRAELPVHTFFTDGLNEEVDVYRVGGDDGAIAYEALARVFFFFIFILFAQFSDPRSKIKTWAVNLELEITFERGNNKKKKKNK